MKKILLLSVLSVLYVGATELKLSEKALDNWKIKTAKASVSDTLPLGSFIVKVTTPPTLLHSITLPFQAQVLSLNVASYQKVNKGDLLATVTGTEWIEVQKKTISDAIELRHHKHLAERKNRLCREGIIPKKECMAANAEMKTDEIKLSASKALLKSFGASDSIVRSLLKQLKITSSIPIVADTDGVITTLNAQVGQTTDSTQALFVIQKEGDLWLESDMPYVATASLQRGSSIQLGIDNKVYASEVLELSPTIDVQNQSRHVRFSMAKDSGLLIGMRPMAEVLLTQKSLRIPKKSLIQNEGVDIVFVQKGDVFIDVAVTVLGEDAKYYYLQDIDALHQPIVTTSIAVLKGMLGAEDE